MKKSAQRWLIGSFLFSFLAFSFALSGRIEKASLLHPLFEKSAVAADDGKQMIYSTFFSADNAKPFDFGGILAVDSAGNTYLLGRTCTLDPSDPANIPLPNVDPNFGRFCGKNPNNDDIGDAYVVKIDSAGKLVYKTILKSNSSKGETTGLGIAIDSSGNAYVAGGTRAFDLPKATSVPTNNFPLAHAFVTKIDSSGAVVYTTYLSGTAIIGNNFASGVAVDTSGNVYVTGSTNARNFPIVGTPLQATSFKQAANPITDLTDAFFVKLDNNGTVVYSSFLGGNSSDAGESIGVDSSGNIYIGGTTSSTAAIVKAGVVETKVGPGGMADVFVTKISADGSKMIYFTKLGGTAVETTGLFAFDASYNVYVTGITFSADFLTGANPPPTIQKNLNGTSDGFIAKLDTNGALVYSTYLGGSGDEKTSGVKVDVSGNAYLIGHTTSANFPVTLAPFQETLKGTSDAFLTKIDPTASKILYSTYFGGSNIEFGGKVGLDTAGNVHIGGYTRSQDLPTRNPLQPAFLGSSDLFLARFAVGEAGGEAGQVTGKGPEKNDGSGGGGDSGGNSGGCSLGSMNSSPSGMLCLLGFIPLIYLRGRRAYK